MAPLTWREVAAPNFSGVSESQRLAGQLLNTGFQSTIDALDGFGKGVQTSQSNEFAARVAAYGNDTAGLQSALRSGTIYDGLGRGNITVDALKFGLGREAEVLANDGSRLLNANQAEVNDQLTWKNDVTQAYEAARPAAVDLVNQIRSAAAAGTPEGRAKAEELMRSGSAVFSAAGWTPEDINGQINGNMSTSTAGIAVNGAFQEQADSNKARAEREKAIAAVNQAFSQAGDPASAARLLRNRDDLNANEANLALQMLEQSAGAFGPAADPRLLALEESIAGQPQSNPLRNAIVGTESGSGGYDTLFGHSQRDGGAFAGVSPSRMTLAQLDQFEKEGGYGNWVKDQVGRTATPMGAYQIVGTTRRQVAKEMGLPADTVFTPEVQDAMFYHLVDKRISGPRSMQGKIDGLRQEWEGLKNVSNNDLAAAITAYEKGDRSGFGAITGTGGAAAGPAAAPYQSALDRALSATGSLPGGGGSGIQSYLDRGTELTNQSQAILDRVTSDNVFGNQNLLTELTQRPNRGKSEADLVKEMKARLGDGTDISEGDLRRRMNEVQEEFGMDYDVAAAFMMNALEQNPWGTRWLFGDSGVNRNEFRNLVSQYYNADGTTPDQKFQPMVEQLVATRAKNTASEQISQIQAQVEQFKQEYANAVQRQKDRPGSKIDIEGARLRYEASLAQWQDLIGKLDVNTLLSANTSAKLPGR